MLTPDTQTKKTKLWDRMIAEKEAEQIIYIWKPRLVCLAESFVIFFSFFFFGKIRIHSEDNHTSSGILYIASSLATTIQRMYKAHCFWRRNILGISRVEWKTDVYVLLLSPTLKILSPLFHYKSVHASFIQVTHARFVSLQNVLSIYATKYMYMRLFKYVHIFTSKMFVMFIGTFQTAF